MTKRSEPQSRILLEIIRELKRPTPLSNSLPRSHGRSHRQHWTGWLAEYEGPGYYERGRKKRDARFIYQHLHCAPMVIWLAELAGVPQAKIKQAIKAAAPDPESYRDSPGAAAAARRILPWSLVQLHLADATRKGRLLAP